jgi:hypothetical protein
MVKSAKGGYREVRRCVPARLGRYRYLLEIALAEAPGPRLAVVLKNPSTASAERSDPTIGKAEAWARRRGFASLSVVNLFAYRSPHPKKLNAPSYRKTVGPENDRHILAAATGAELVVAGWGNPNGIDPEKYERRIEEVLALLRPFPLYGVGEPTRAGHPRHALLWNGNPRAALFSPNGG